MVNELIEATVFGFLFSFFLFFFVKPETETG